MPAQLTFLGAAGTVTGSRYLLSSDGWSYLVDCGLFQGGHRMEQRNWEPFGAAPDKLDAVLLTHAHIDHVGYLPRLVVEGFHGSVYATEATCALLELILPDSAHLQEQDAAFANKRGFGRHRPALPLYTAADAERALSFLRPVPFQQEIRVDGLAVTWRPAGHLLGSAILEIELDSVARDRRLVFSGDLGRYDSEVMRPPTEVKYGDVLLVESTYGDRRHDDASIAEGLSSALHFVAESKGVLLIPSFAVGRTQQVLYHIRRLQDSGKAPDIPVYIDSPMAVDASRIYCRFGDDHNLDVNLLMDEGACPLRCRDTRFVSDVADSKALNSAPGPAVILSASGMLSGGRILHHLKWRLPDPRNAVLFVGYQAEGTRGRALVEGAQSLRIHGEVIPARAKITRIDALSGHADREELLRWLSGFSELPSRIYVVHGEPAASLSLKRLVGERLGSAPEIAKQGLSVDLV